MLSFTTEQVANEPVEGTNVYTVNGVSFKMIEVEGGTFTMGSSDSDSNADSDEKPAHQVTLSSYYIGETEVTQALWQEVMGSNPSCFTGDLQRPVEQVSWYDCQTFVNKLNELTGENFRLPTEAEWEYAARGGKESTGYKNSSSNSVGGVTLYGIVSRETNVVKSMEPNELGIYEMLGNVWEWCSDWYGSYSSSAQTNPTGPSSGTYRVLRGGGNFVGDMYAANREPNSPDNRYKFNGLRLAISSTEGDNNSEQVVPITVTTGEATNITSESATLSGVVVGASQAINCGIIYGTASDITSLNNNRDGGYYDGAYSIDVSYLQPGTTYYYCAYAIIDGEEQYGEVLSFTTSELPAPSKTYTVNGVSFKMIEVEGGTFTMGSPDSDSDADSDEKPIHQVTLSSYYIGETEVTQELWQAVMGSNPSYYTGDLQRPVEQVSWYDCQTFISKLNELTGESFVLPTEAEWEYAARGGKKNNGYKYSGSNTIDDVALYQEDLFVAVRTNAVKAKKPNELGIYDMSGNVLEWCSDWYGSYSSSSQTNPIGPSSGSERVHRGGSYSFSAKSCRVACRSRLSPDIRAINGGFRLAISSTERDDAPITITTGEATNITSESATLSGVVSGATNGISCGIIYGTASDITSLNNNREGGYYNGAYSIDVSYLQPATTYYYCAYAFIDGEEQLGEVCSFTTSNVPNILIDGFEAVDLGLSVKWATHNVGAGSPEEYGEYFAWGETSPKSSYTESNSVTYGLSNSELKSRGIIGSDGNLTAEYDAATVNWGGNWRMPTLDEMKELLNNCTWKWTTQNGVYGRKVTGPNGNSIFLPAAGCRGDRSLFNAGSGGDYSSATPYSISGGACSLYFGSGGYDWGSFGRDYGFAVRPVSEQ